MSDLIKKLKADLAAAVAKAKEITAEIPKKTGKDADDLNVLLAETITAAKGIRQQIEDQQFLETNDAWLNEPEPKAKPKSKGVTGDDDDEGYPSDFIRSRNLKAFTSGTRVERERKAYRFGQYVLASVLGNEKAFQWCVDHGIKMCYEVGDEGLRQVKTMKESINTTGGFLVPVEFDSELIDLRETFGVFRQNARVVTMTAEKLQRSRRVSGLTAYFAGEATAVTESEKGWDQIELSAKKLLTYTRISSELSEDATIDMADDLMMESGYAFSAKEDDCGFNGDASSPFGGILGLRQRLVDVYTTGGGVGLVVGAGASYSALTLANFNSVVGSLPEFAERPDTAWYVSKFFWGSVMQRLALAAGGATAEEIEGKRRRTFLGYPVIVSQKMPKTSASAQVCCLFGSLRLSSDFGDRRRASLSMSEHRHHDTDEIGVKGRQRFDILNHSVGDTTDAGPVVGLITA